MKIKGIKYIGPILDNSGYAQACRSNILALDSIGVPLMLNPISFESARPELGKYGDRIKQLSENNIDYNVVLIHTTPEFWSRHIEHRKVNVGYTIWETDKLHPDWPKYINSTVDKVLVGCEWNIGVFKNSGVSIPIGSVPHPINVSDFDGVVPYDIAGVDKDAYVFYNIQQWCYDDKTRVLTKGGFKYFKDLTYEDEIATLNKDTDELEYYNPDEIVKFKRQDKMFHLTGSQFDLCVNPEHKIVVKEHMKNSYKVDSEDSWTLKPLNEMIIINKDKELKVSSKYRTKKSCKWSGKKIDYFEVPYSNSKYPLNNKESLKLPIDSFMRFMGWYLSEGSIEITRNYYRVVITQTKNAEYRKEIWECIEELGFTPIDGGKNIIFNSRELCLYLQQFGKCYEKYITNDIKNLCTEHLLLLLDSLIKGDGSFHKNGTWCKYVTTSKRLAEDVQECLLKVGISGAVSVSDHKNKKPGSIDGRIIQGTRLQYTVSINKENNEPSMYYANLKEIEYDGYIYCARVKNHTMLVERNGKVLFCGNTERKHPIALIKAYWYAFQNDENVALILKTYRSDYSDAEKEAIRISISRLKAVTPFDKYPIIYLITDMLSNNEILGLHAKGDCYVSLDRGEGFGLSPATAGACGNPIIVTGFGGSTEYAKSDNSYLVNYSLTPVSGMPWSPWYRGNMLWAEPDVLHGAQLMQHVYNNREESQQKGNRLKEYIKTNLSPECIGNKIIKEIELINYD